MKKETKSSIKKIAFGAAIGAALGVLFAPKSGKETRKALKEKATDLINKAKEIDVIEVRDNVIEKAKIDTYVKTLFKRKRNIPELKNTVYTIRQSGERIALNTPIQGTAADIIKLAMVKVYETFEKNNIKSKMIIQVHDELIFDTKKEELEKGKEIVKDVMENVYELNVPLKVDINCGKNWAEAKWFI